MITVCQLDGGATLACIYTGPKIGKDVISDATRTVMLESMPDADPELVYFLLAPATLRGISAEGGPEDHVMMIAINSSLVRDYKPRKSWNPI